VSVMSEKQAIVPADMQRRAKKIAVQASKLADEARPMTEKAASNARRGVQSAKRGAESAKRGAESAKRGAGTAAEWARPRVNRSRAWLAVRATRGSVAVQETVAPRVADLMATAAKKLDPPKKRPRRLPKVLAGVALLAAGAAAAGAMAIRNKRMLMGTMPPPMSPASGSAAGQVTVMDPASGTDRPSREADVDGLSRTP
jgi:hypothetical protein